MYKSHVYFNIGASLRDILSFVWLCFDTNYDPNMTLHVFHEESRMFPERNWAKWANLVIVMHLLCICFYLFKNKVRHDLS